MICYCPAYEQGGKILGTHGPAKEKALSLVAAMRFQESKLPRRFDAFGHNLLLEAYAHRNKVFI